MKYVRLAYRIPAFIFFSGFFACFGLLLKVLGVNHSKVFSTVFTPWRQLMIFFLNVKIHVEGELPNEPAIIMANHRSYVDVLMLLSNMPVVFVAKASVSKWPIIGWGGDALDTLWVNRADKDSRRNTREQLKVRLHKNKSVVIFPEGTTHKGPDILDLKPGMFHTVADGGFTIIPLAIEYKDPNIAWIDDDKFVPHFIEQFGKPRIDVKIAYGDPILGDDGEVLREETAKWLRNKLQYFRAQWDKE